MTISFLLITGIVEHVSSIHFSLHVTEILKDIRDEIVNHIHDLIVDSNTLQV